MISKLLSRRRPDNIKNTISSAPTLSTIVNIDVPAVVQTPLTVITFSPRRTPFGTHRTPMNLPASLKASLSKGTESLAAALDGVLALHHRLEELRQQNNDKGPDQVKEDLRLSPTDLGQIAYM